MNSNKAIPDLIALLVLIDAEAPVVALAKIPAIPVRWMLLMTTFVKRLTLLPGSDLHRNGAASLFTGAEKGPVFMV